MSKRSNLTRRTLMSGAAALPAVAVHDSAIGTQLARAYANGLSAAGES